MQTAAHNPEVVGSSPASATIKSPEVVRFQDFSFTLRLKSSEKFGAIREQTI